MQPLMKFFLAVLPEAEKVEDSSRMRFCMRYGTRILPN